MKRIQLTYEEAVEDLRAVIAERPEHTEDRRAYFAPDGSPCCLLGYALARRGVRYEDLSIPDPESPNDRITCNDEAVATLLDLGVLVVDGPTKNLLVRAQVHSDGGLTWGLFPLEACGEERSELLGPPRPVTSNRKPNVCPQCGSPVHNWWQDNPMDPGDVDPRADCTNPTCGWGY